MAEAAQVNALDAVGLRNTTLQGVPLVDLDVEEFMRPVNERVRANFLTARLAGRAWSQTAPRRASVGTPAWQRIGTGILERQALRASNSLKLQ